MNEPCESCKLKDAHIQQLNAQIKSFVSMAGKPIAGNIEELQGQIYKLEKAYEKLESENRRCTTRVNFYAAMIKEASSLLNAIPYQSNPMMVEFLQKGAREALDLPEEFLGEP